MISGTDAPFFQSEFALLQHQVLRRYGEALDLGTVG